MGLGAIKMAKRKLPEINPKIDEVENKPKRKSKKTKEAGQPYIDENGALVVRQIININEEDKMTKAAKKLNEVETDVQDPLEEAGLSVEEQIQLLLNPDTSGDLIASFTSNKELMDNLSHVAKQLKEPLVDILTTLTKDKEVVKLVNSMGLNKLVEKSLTKEDVLKIVEGKFATKQDIENMISNIEVNTEGVVVNNNTSNGSTKSGTGFFKSIKNEIEGWFEPSGSETTFNFKLEKEDLVGSEFMKDMAKRLRDSGVEPKYLS